MRGRLRRRILDQVARALPRLPAESGVVAHVPWTPSPAERLPSPAKAKTNFQGRVKTMKILLVGHPKDRDDALALDPLCPITPPPCRTGDCTHRVDPLSLDPLGPIRTSSHRHRSRLFGNRQKLDDAVPRGQPTKRRSSALIYNEKPAGASRNPGFLGALCRQGCLHDVQGRGCNRRGPAEATGVRWRPS